jgi:hypothetical protein
VEVKERYRSIVRFVSSPQMTQAKRSVTKDERAGCRVERTGSIWTSQTEHVGASERGGFKRGSVAGKGIAHIYPSSFESTLRHSTLTIALMPSGALNRTTDTYPALSIKTKRVLSRLLL